MDYMVKEMKSSIDRVKKEYEDDRHYHYHLNQFHTPYRSTIHLQNFIKTIIPNLDSPYKIIDVCCGGGANIHQFAKIFPNSDFIGLDSTNKFFNLGEKFIDKNINYNLKKGDCFKLSKIFGRESFDIVLSIQTLSYLPDYENALQQLINVSKKWIFISSLFTTYNVDIINNVYLFEEEKWERKMPYNYNIYSTSRFEYFCKKYGAKRVIFSDFLIDIDIPKADTKSMSTYTIMQPDIRRLQFSGPLYMPWKFVAIEK